MATVQELLLAAKAKQPEHPLSMLADLINAAGTGYKEGSDIRNVRSESDYRRSEIAKNLVEQHLKQQQLDQEVQNGQMIRNFIAQTLGIKDEQALRQGVAATGAPPTPVKPSDKFDVELGLDEQGKGSIKIKSKAAKVAAPAGFRYSPDGQSLEPIPGGPADIKAQEAKVAADAKLASRIEKSKNVLDTIDEAIPLVSGSTAGYGSYLKGLPAGPANALSKKLKTILSNLSVDQIAEMKSESRTGATGFGALNEKELEVIQNAVTNLEQNQDPEILKQNLKKLKTHYSNWLEMQKGNNPYKNASGGNETPEQRKARLIKELQEAK